jgi:hypothetical protein
MKSCLNLCGAGLGSEKVHNDGLHIQHRISRDRYKFSSIPVIASAIRIAFSWIRYRWAVEVCWSRRNPDHDQTAERNQTRQPSQVRRDVMDDYSGNYSVCVRRTDDLQFVRAFGAALVTHVAGLRFFFAGFVVCLGQWRQFAQKCQVSN